jgi:hypothetical protein
MMRVQETWLYVCASQSANCQAVAVGQAWRGPGPQPAPSWEGGGCVQSVYNPHRASVLWLVPQTDIGDSYLLSTENPSDPASRAVHMMLVCQRKRYCLQCIQTSAMCRDR